ncbi:uncharacterized protein LOC133286688, partial [Gastrolobium bilobum]|uniref:uncharacterized protein LOC133286688 n=1 Tax=Gastrolobium bilobum TaxID=150636 RepID=UPI002AB0C47D
GKMGASLHRSSKSKAIGGKPPYLMPYFGMFGYGGPIASMHLGRRALVSSKTKHVKKVYMLFLEREALLSASSSKMTWKTDGGIRDPSEDEIRDSDGSFTRVDIYEPKVKDVDISRLQCHLKDIYFPYIQVWILCECLESDDMSDEGKTITPTEFQVNEVDLTEIQGGEVAITNLHSCNGPEFVLQLHLSLVPDHDGIKSAGSREFQEANARLRFLYFPFTEGKENIEKVLEKLMADGFVRRENFQGFSRVSIRRLGRLLPDARWTFLPFMDLRNKKGNKANILKRCSLRVKCFIETDAGFKPTLSKTDLAHHNPFTTTLKNLGNKASDKEKDVIVEIRKNTKVLTPLQLEKEYQEWILQMHDQYDEEADSGEDQPTIIVSPTNKKALCISSDVIRVHQVLKRREKYWKRGQKVKVLKGACAGCYKTTIYATIEYFLLEGFEGDTGGEARIICRPIDIPDENGCVLSVGDEDASLDIHGSLSLPLTVIDSGKFVAVESIEWDNRLNKKQQKSPASIDLLGPSHVQQREVDGVPGIKMPKGKNDVCQTPSSDKSILHPQDLPSFNQENNIMISVVNNCAKVPGIKMPKGKNDVCQTPSSEKSILHLQDLPSFNQENNLMISDVNNDDMVSGIKIPEGKNDVGQTPSADKTIMHLQDLPSFNQENNLMISVVDNGVQKLEGILRLGEKIHRIESHLNNLNELKAETDQEMLQLLEKVQPYQLGDLDSFSTKDELTTKIGSMENSAAGVLSTLSMHQNPQNYFMEDIIGIVALLGTVQSPELSRILTEYLGEDNMLAVICRSFDAAQSLEKYTQNGEIDCGYALHAEAASLGKSISKRFRVICFEDIRPYTGCLRGKDFQRKLCLPRPCLSNGKTPAGFIGYAVNMVDLDIDHMQTRTALGHGLRETVLFSLFKKLHVYKTRESMVAARACIVDGAVSLDGGILRENAVLSLGYGNPSICFRCVNPMVLSPETGEILSQIKGKKSDLRTIEEEIGVCSKRREKYLKKFTKKKKRYHQLMDRMEHDRELLDYKTGQGTAHNV